MHTICMVYFLNTCRTYFNTFCCSVHVFLDISFMSCVVQILSRCPACFHNFVSLYCRMTCDTKQSRFLAANKFTTSKTRKTAISEVTYAVSEQFGFGMFNSCRDVQNPSSGQHALDMLCGKDASKCTPANWLEFMGDKSLNPVVPFTIKFDLSANSTVPGPNGTTLYPMWSEIEACNESCSCQDCRAQCRPLPPEPPSTSWTILGYDAMFVIMACSYATFSILFVLAHIVWYMGCAKDDSSGQYIVNGNSDTVSLVSAGAKSAVCCGSSERLQARFERLLSTLFSAWGEFCARHTLAVILVSVVICGILTVGCALFTVVTDPVELWSSPNSRARTEKNYFDTNFG